VSVSKSGKAKEAEGLYREWILSGAGGSVEGVARGVRGLHRAAELGPVGALADLGDAYRMGRLVPVDDGAAYGLYKRAAEGGNVVAMGNVGSCLWDGRGVGADRKSGLQWFIKAAEHGFSVAMYKLGRLYEEGGEVEVDTKVALVWHRKAALRGHAGSMARIGCALAGSDPRTAAVWFKRAAAWGDVDAMLCWEGCMTSCAIPRAPLLGTGGQPRAVVWRGE
jgi:TPR repeat protein